MFNVHALNDRTSKDVWQKLIKQQGERDESTRTVGDLNTRLSRKWTDPTGRKLARTELNPNPRSISWM